MILYLSWFLVLVVIHNRVDIIFTQCHEQAMTSFTKNSSTILPVGDVSLVSKELHHCAHTRCAVVHTWWRVAHQLLWPIHAHDKATGWWAKSQWAHLPVSMAPLETTASISKPACLSAQASPAFAVAPASAALQWPLRRVASPDAV